jgi:hypothetical protein
MTASALADEQRIDQLAPAVEQRVEAVGAGDREANVQGVEQIASQDVGVQEPPSTSQKAASTAGKVAVSILAAGISLGAMAASLLFL